MYPDQHFARHTRNARKTFLNLPSVPGNLFAKCNEQGPIPSQTELQNWLLLTTHLRAR